MKTFILLVVVLLIVNYLVRKGRKNNSSLHQAHRSSAPVNSVPSPNPPHAAPTVSASTSTASPVVASHGGEKKYFDRTVTFPDFSASEYVYVERIDAHGDSLAETESLGDELKHINGGIGFGGVLRDATGRALSPDWLDVQKAATWSSRVALGASISHTAFEGHSTALDLGGYDGRNMTGWSGSNPSCIAYPTKSLFLGDMERNWLEISRLGASIGSIDFSPDGRFVVQSEWWGNRTSTVVLVDAASQERSLLFVDDDAFDARKVSFSPDGGYVLASTEKESVLIALGEGALGSGVQVLVAGDSLPSVRTFAWWPTKDATLLVIDQERNDDGVTGHIKQYDLRTETLADVCAIDYSHEIDDLLSAPIRVDPSGTRALCGSYAGMSEVLRQSLGGRRRVAMLDLTNGTLKSLAMAHPDGDERFVRVHEDWHWTSTNGVTEVDNPSPAIIEAANTLRTVEHWNSPDNSHVVRDAMNTAVLSLRAMVGQTPQDMDNPFLLPEVRRMLEFVHEMSPDMFEGIREYLDKSSFHGAVFSNAQDQWTWLRVGVEEWLDLEDFQRIKDFGIPEWRHFEA